ncbi:hypothetical protein BDV19DRAFT_370370 [Aspergillus venezuelensis]
MPLLSCTSRHSGPDIARVFLQTSDPPRLRVPSLLQARNRRSPLPTVHGVEPNPRSSFDLDRAIAQLCLRQSFVLRGGIAP